MSTTVNVLCPNGRRSQIKVQPNTKILEILEEVCKKQGFNPNEHCLVHQKKALDVTLTFRLSGVSNNGHLELRVLETGPRTYADVILVLQLDDGSRLSAKSFSPNETSLEQVLQAYKDESELLHVAFNEKLADETDTYPMCVYLNEQVVGLRQFKHTTLKDLGLINGRGIIRFGYKTIDKEQFSKLEFEFEQKLSRKIKLEEEFKKKVEEKTSEPESKPAYVVPQMPQQLPETFPVLEPVQRQQQQQKRPKQEPISLGSTLGVSLEPEPVVYQQNEFVNFKFPEETKGMNLNDMNELAVIEQQSREACDRQAVIYNMDESTDKRRLETGELPEDFFEITVNDLKYMVSDLKRIQKEESVLMTRQMREIEQDKRAMRYSKVAIRICFKNRQTLQGLFRPKELVAALYKFVQESFTSDNSKEDLDFYLYTSPPKIVVNEMKKTLFDSKLCPASFVYFKNKSDRVPKFKTDLKMVTLDQAEELVNKEVHQQIRQIEHEGLNWLHREQQIVQNIMSSTSFSQPQPSSSRPQSRMATPSVSNVDQEKNKKLQFFLTGSKN